MDQSIRLKIMLAYQGTHYMGWQLQAEGRRSVQGCLEEALTRLAGVHVRAQGASRTDAGVHALCQCAHADVPASRAHLPWQRALNAILPKDLAVLSVEVAPPGFHARRASSMKTYTYHLWHETAFLLPQRRHYVWPVGPLDLPAMEEAARELVGKHDFAAFRNLGTPVRDTIRTVTAIERLPGTTQYESVWAVSGPGFLKQMVRNIMGALVEVGRGKANPEFIRFLLATKDRSLAPATAPAKGLCLERMEFGPRERFARHPGREDDHLDRPDQEGLGGPGGAVPR